MRTPVSVAPSLKRMTRRVSEVIRARGYPRITKSVSSSSRSGSVTEVRGVTANQPSGSSCSGCVWSGTQAPLSKT